MKPDSAADMMLGSVVQIDPAFNDNFGGCFMVVERVKNWGVDGYVLVPGKGPAYVRVAFGEFFWVGFTKWGIGP